MLPAFSAPFGSLFHNPKALKRFVFTNWLRRNQTDPLLWSPCYYPVDVWAFSSTSLIADFIDALGLTEANHIGLRKVYKPAFLFKWKVSFLHTQVTNYWTESHVLLPYRINSLLQQPQFTFLPDVLCVKLRRKGTLLFAGAIDQVLQSILYTSVRH